MTYNLAALLSFLVAFQLFFVSLYLFTHKKGNARNNRLLGLVFLMFSLSLSDFTIRVSGIVLPVPFLHLIDDGFFLLYGPVLYYYVQGVVYRDFKFRLSNLAHAFPYALFTSYLFYQLVSTDLDTQTEVTGKIVTAELPIWMLLASLIIYGHILTYLWLAWRTSGLVTFIRTN